MRRRSLVITLAGLIAIALGSGFALASSHGGSTVRVAIWQSTSDPSQIHLSTQVEGSAWQTDDTPLTLSAKGSGAYVRSEIVEIAVPAPADYVPQSVGATATANMVGPDGASMGTVTIEQGPRSVILRATVSGLTEGWHGFHIHQTGSCSPDFKAAGSHLNLAGRGHGELSPDGTHTGDLPNI